MEDRLPPVPDQKTLVLVNTFVVHTTQLLNHFAATCETKLAEINRRVHRIDAALSLLEAKLRSTEQHSKGRASVTEGREPGGATSVVDDQSTQETRDGHNGHEDENASQTGADGFLRDHASASEASVAEPREKGSTKAKVLEHPDYLRFFKMLAVGVPSQAVAVQMRIEGLNPAYLETPDEPFPDAPT